MQSDLALIEQVKSGDSQAFSTLVLRHQRALLRLCIRFVKSPDLAEDVVQEVFVKVHKKLHLFEGRSAFKSWLYQIAINTAKNKLRKVKYTLNIEDVQIAMSEHVETNLIQENIKILLLREVEKLPERQKLALKLRIYEELSFKEVAEIMGCPYDTAKANYRHGLMKIRETFKQKELLKYWGDTSIPVSVEVRSSN